MVVFTCNACGESVKKGQVEKHVNMCRNCECLSCMDCGKDFWGDDYKCHVKCLSEDQKYGGKGYEVKTHKGDAKQQEWIQKIHETIKKTNINPRVQDILQQICAYDNIPRKKKKFQNWMANSLKIHNTALQDQVWDIFAEATSKETIENHSAKNVTVTVPTPSEDNVKTEKPVQKKCERKQKEKRENIKKPKEIRLQAQEENLLIKSKKSKKEKLRDENAKMSKSYYLKMAKQEAVDSTDLEKNGNCLDAKELGAKVNMKKRNLSIDESPIAPKRMNNPETEENEDTHQGKFSWKGTIKAVLKQAPDNEISIKKLRKKVLAQYYAIEGDHHKSEEEILALFNKKVNSNPKFRVLKEKVKLLK
ncbi:cell growth-regulating nucleolar protein isoform X1 [Varanus komodoensis]|uniref:Ly1 antibody reactive n=1 Tax=Varanus komodoensis TaxID=61221 RepID=A0A8D2L170_VARKO|nr:cell growth-regulating nucleolar protein isoform X1 [Varanus komodoensis]XP_044273937.1 cell growth-regulating nucleolar protein isoform X1 [Varanus komodoensis]